jgi:formylglycine-generating enzyme required for sulfatase activity
MHGNVHEWTSDWYASSYPAGSATDPVGPTTGSSLVIRGGNYGYPGHYTRSARRMWSSPGGPSPILGFRLSLRP